MTFVLLAGSALFAGLLAFFLTPLTIKLAQSYGLVDDIKKRKHPANVHTGIIPRAGGLPIFISILFASLLFIKINLLISGVLLGAGLITLMGILDDKYDLSPYVRFIMNILIVFVVILFGLGVPYITNPLGGVIHLDSIVWTVNFMGTHDFLIWANIFSLLWIVALMNFINWSSGVDGQLSGFTSIAALFLGFLALRFTGHEVSSISVAVLAFIVAGSFGGFTPWNYYPQRIMPGYSGGALAGYMLGVLSILSWGKIGTMMLVLSVPIVDAIYIIIRRLKEKKSPFHGDAGHFHHKLLKIGWGKRRIAIFYWLVSFLLGLSAMFFSQTEKVIALIVVFVLIAFFIVVMNRLEK